MTGKAIIRVHDDKNGKTHINVYSNDPKLPHDSIHFDSPNDGTGKVNIVEKFSGKKSTSTINIGK